MHVISFNRFAFFQPDDSLDESREATPDSDSGYVVSAKANVYLVESAPPKQYQQQQHQQQQQQQQQQHQQQQQQQFFPDVIRRRVVEQTMSAPTQASINQQSINQQSINQQSINQQQQQRPFNQISSPDSSSLSASMTLAGNLKCLSLKINLGFVLISTSIFFNKLITVS
jgi:hypothetical protein